MEKENKSRKSLQYYMRAVHRVLGYFAVGLVMVYAFSGIVLIHRTGDFMKHDVAVATTLQPGLDAEQLGTELRLRSFKVTEENEQAIVFTDGRYDKQSGEVSYVKKELLPPLGKMVGLHVLSDGKNPHIAALTTIFGVVLFLLAFTSLFMFKVRTRQFRNNMIYTALGVVLTVLLLILV